MLLEHVVYAFCYRDYKVTKVINLLCPSSKKYFFIHMNLYILNVNNCVGEIGILDLYKSTPLCSKLIFSILTLLSVNLAKILATTYL